MRASRSPPPAPAEYDARAQAAACASPRRRNISPSAAASARPSIIETSVRHESPAGAVHRTSEVAVVGSAVSMAATVLSDAGDRDRPVPHGAAIRSANRRNGGVRARSPAAGNATLADRTQPAPNAASVAAGSPSLQRATTRPTGGPTARANWATTVAGSAPPEAAVTAYAVSARARRSQ